MNNYKNKKIADVKTIFDDFGVKTYIVGNGDKVIEQYPKKGIDITVKDYVILVTNDNNRTVPKLVGVSINEAKTVLAYLDLKYEIEKNSCLDKQEFLLVACLAQYGED